MADKDDDKTVVVEDDNVIEIDVTDIPALVDGAKPAAPVNVQTGAVTPKPAARAATAVDDAATALQTAMKVSDDARRAAEATADAERRARGDAERRAQQAAEESKRYKETAEDHQLTIVTSGIEAAQQQQEAAQAEWAAAMEAGEFVKAAAASGKISTAAAQIVQLQSDKVLLERVAKTGGAVEEPRQAATQAPSFEQYVGAFTPKSQAWLRMHPDCVPPQFGGNPTRHYLMMAGHSEATSKNIAPESPEYFQMIEDKLGEHRAAAETAPSITSVAADTTPAVVDPKTAPRQRAAPVAAPVSRDPPGPAGQRMTRSVTLTRDQQEAARISFPDKPLREAYSIYAKNLLELEAEGRMGRTTH